MRGRTRAILLSVTIAIVGTCTSGADVGLQLIARSGEPATGVAGDGFRSFSEVLFDAQGGLVFRATLDGATTGLLGRSGLWREANGVRSLIAYVGGPAPEYPDATLNIIDRFSMSGSGRVSFFGNVSGPDIPSSTTAHALWSYEDGVGASIVIRQGEPAWDPPGHTMSGGDGQPLDQPGQWIIEASTTDPEDPYGGTHGVWLLSGGAFAPVLRIGDPAPWDPALVIGAVGVLNRGATDAGSMLGSVTVTGPGIDYSNDGVIFAGAADSLRSVARKLDPAPGTGGALFDGFSGGLLPRFGGASLDDDGDTALWASLTGPLSHGSADHGVWMEREGALQLVVRYGDPAPDAPGTAFISIGNPIVNGPGALTFVGASQGPSQGDPIRRGFWTERDGALRLLVSDGDAAPGIAGVTISDLGTPIEFGIVVHDDGVVAFRSKLQGDGVDLSNDRALWCADTNGAISLVVREGDTLDVSVAQDGSDLRTVNSFAITTSDGAHGARRPVGPSGAFGIAVGFTDGSAALFLATPSSACVGDLNGDGAVDGADLGLLLGGWGGPDADLSGDGVTNGADLGLLLGGWGAC